MALPKEAITVRFPPNALVDESYQLLELPPEILKAVEAGETVPLTIKGRPHDDAVLCTSTRTYSLRTVDISNSLVILRSPSDDLRTLHIRDVCHQVLECVASPGRVERLRGVLKDSAWGGLSENTRKRKREKRYTLQQLQSIIQASDAELVAALAEINAVEVDGHITLLPPAHLSELIGVLLNLITIHGRIEDEHTKCPASEIFAGLSHYDVDARLTSAVMRLFGSVEDEVWCVEIPSLVRECGRGLLVNINTKPTPVNTFLASWETAVGEYSAHVELSTLEGNYLLSDPPPTAFAPPCKNISYFPVHTLPIHVPTRFADLFLTRARWRPEEMSPFLAGLYPPGDTKAKDKLIAKYVRVVKEKDGAWWYPRRTG